MNRIISVIIPIVKVVVKDDNRTIVITQRTPADIIHPAIPVHPGRPPTPGRDPIPSQAESPVPSAIMGNTPSPRLIGTPCPATDRVPDPSSMVVGPPRVVVDIRNPDIPIGSFIHPITIVVQFGFILIHINRQIPCSHISVVKDITAPVPFCKSILVSGVNVIGTRGEKSGGSSYPVSGMDYFRTFFTSSFDGTFNHKNGCFLIISYLKAVESLF
jgi:hypothetical protein